MEVEYGKTYVGVGLVDQLHILALLGEGLGADYQLDVGQNGLIHIIYLLKNILVEGVRQPETDAAEQCIFIPASDQRS